VCKYFETPSYIRIALIVICIDDYTKFAAYFSSDRRLNADFKGYWNRGMGKPNFVGAWERDGATLDYYEFEYEYENKDRRQKMMDVTLVPYSSTPPLDLQDILMSYHFSQKKFPRHLRYGDFFTHAINDILGGIWDITIRLACRF
jgi:hypothetical protein